MVSSPFKSVETPVINAPVSVMTDTTARAPPKVAVVSTTISEKTLPDTALATSNGNARSNSFLTTN